MHACNGVIAQALALWCVAHAVSMSNLDYKVQRKPGFCKFHHAPFSPCDTCHSADRMLGVAAGHALLAWAGFPFRMLALHLGVAV
jgi:hypothetical protein